jgi:CHRD domain-containing protein
MSSRLALSAFALGLTIAAFGCGKDTPATPTPAPDPKFTATLLPSNEAPTPVTNADATGSGTVTITMHNTKDASGNITASTADFTVTLQGFPPNTVLTGAHIHPGATGAAGGVIWSTTLASGEVTLNASGAGTFTKLGATGDIAVAQAILANPAGYYFNVHTQLNGGGAARGQLVRAN